MKKEKSAKDLAFDRERAKYRKEINDLRVELDKKEIEKTHLSEKVSELENKCSELKDWIDRLLEYTEITEDDMKKIIRKDVETSKAMEHFNSLVSVMDRFGFGGGAFR